MYGRLAVERRGGTTQAVAWDFSQCEDDDQQHRQVMAQVDAAVEELTVFTGAPPLVIGKSLGTLAAPVAADRGLPAVWLTPLLTDEPTVAALRRATAPCLLIGGTADELWDGAIARSLSAHVLEIEAADHGMFLPGPLAASAAVLAQVITAVEDFLDQIA